MIVYAICDAQCAKVMESAARQVVYYTAKWCGPCQLLAPELDKLDKSNTYKIVKVDVDECPEWTDRQGINVVPSLQVWENGKVVHKIIGCQAKDLQTLADGNELP